MQWLLISTFADGVMLLPSTDTDAVISVFLCLLLPQSPASATSLPCLKI